MSLINQMLRDLEARRAAERRTQGGGIFAGLTSGAATAQSPRWLFVLSSTIIIVLLLLIAYLAWQRFSAQPAAISTPQAPAPISAASAPSGPVESTSTPVSTVATTAPTAEPAAITKPEPNPAIAPITPSVPTPVASDAMGTKQASTLTLNATSEVPSEAELFEKRPRSLSISEQAERAYQQGLKALREGNQATAEAALREALRIDHEHLLAREALAAMLLSAGRRIEAGAVLEAGQRFFARKPTLALMMARIQVDEDKLSIAITTLEQNLHAAGARSDYLAFLAALYQRALRYNDSITAYQRALSLEPGQNNWWAGLGISLENAGRGKEALQAYQQANTADLPPQVARYVQDRIRALSNE